jgi:hypothetical protein
MIREVEAVLEKCTTCQRKKRMEKDPKHTITPSLEGFPFQRIVIDFIGPLSESLKGNQYILTVRDTFSQWLEAFPLRQAEASEVANILTRGIFCRFGLPEVIHSDQYTPFRSGLFQDLTSLLGIRATQTPACNLKPNPVRRIHQDLKDILYALTLDDMSSHVAWEDNVPQAVFAINTTCCCINQLAPYQVLFGWDPPMPLEPWFGLPSDGIPNRPCNHPSYMAKLKTRMSRAKVYLWMNLTDSVDQQRRRYRKNVQPYQAGEQVWLFAPRTKVGSNKKLLPTGLGRGPF